MNMKPNWKVVGLVLLASGLFYWFQLRPVMARKDCHRISFEASKKPENKWSPDLYKKTFDACLHRYGL